MKKYKNKYGEYKDIKDKDGKKVIDLQIYKNREGDITIDVYDKEGKKITDLQK